jgi:MoxR-like ATPase
MKLKQITESLDYLLKADISLLLEGKRGFAKTEIFRQYCRNKDYKLVIQNIGSKSDSGDLIGLPNFTSNGNRNVTEFAMPDWASEVIEYAINNPDSKAIIFFDEINRGRKDLTQAIFSFPLEKRFDHIQFPSNVHVVAAQNPSDGNYVVSSFDDDAWTSRWCKVELTPCPDEWFEYAKENKFDQPLIEFLKVDPRLLLNESFRSWTQINKLLQVATPKHLFRELASGIVSLESIVAFEQFLESNYKKIDAYDVLNNFSKVESDVKKAASEGRLDLLDLVAKELEEIIFVGGENEYTTPRTSVPLTDNQVTNIKKFIFATPMDLGYSFLKRIALFFLTREVDFLFDKEIENFVINSYEIGATK